MKRKKPGEPPRGNPSNSETPEDKVAERVARYSARIAELFAELEALSSRSPATTGRPASHDEHRAAEISGQIRRLTREMNQLREQTGHWHRKEGADREDEFARRRREAEEEKLRLRQYLGRVADAQAALVAHWNADPAPDKREAYDREYLRLDQEYTDVRAQLQRVRQLLANM
jgi:hypothetical protein